MENIIVEKIIKHRQGHYCHALEVNDVYELQACIDSLYNEFVRDYTLKDIIQFFNTIELYCLNADNEAEVFNFDITKYILSL